MHTPFYRVDHHQSPGDVPLCHGLGKRGVVGYIFIGIVINE